MCLWQSGTELNLRRVLSSFRHLLLHLERLPEGLLNLAAGHLIGVFGRLDVRSDGDENLLTDASSIQPIRNLREVVRVRFERSNLPIDGTDRLQCVADNLAPRSLVRKANFLNMVR